jgi:hypothetical protein
MDDPDVSEAPEVGCRYRHTQFGWVIAGVMLASGLFLMGLAVKLQKAGLVAPVVGVLLLVVGVLFCSLTVELRGGWLECWFGPGLMRRRIRLEDVREVEVVRNRWWYGWGIRVTPHGWLWNVSGLDAVELRFRDGKKFRIGTDEPEKLAAAIRRAIER